MKIKPTPTPGRVVVEVGQRDERLLAGNAVSMSFQLRKILVPIDFSDCSKKALRYAVPFARQFGAALTLLNVVQITYPTGELGPVAPPVAENEAREASQTALETLVKREVGEGLPAAATVRFGQPAEEIVLAASELEVDLIIISTHGHTGLKHILLGSTAEHVVRRAPCPVLTVREHEHEFLPAESV
jgi:universal stress protein A